MTAGSALKTPTPKTTVSEYAVVLRAAESLPTPQVIIGGQAVSIWAERYLPGEPELGKYLPFTSKDLDLLGNKSDLDQLARLTGYAKVAARPDRWIPSAGYLELPRPDGKPVKVEVLKKLYGATKEEVRDAEQARRKHAIDLIVALPVAELANSRRLRLKKFAEQQLRRWLSKHR